MANDDVGFNKAELKVLALLADEKGHAQWEMRDKLKLDKAYLSKTLKGLESQGLIFKNERSLVRPRKRGPQIEYPYYIQKNQLSNITKMILYQIRNYMGRSKDAHNELKMLKTKGVLSPALEEKLVREKLYYSAEAHEIRNILEIPLYRDCASKIFHLDCISYEGICGILDSEFGLITLHSEQKIMNPEDYFQKHLSNIEYAKKIEAERKKLEADPIAMQKIKEIWVEGDRTTLSQALIGYSQDAVLAQINQMLTCKELSI